MNSAVNRSVVERVGATHRNSLANACEDAAIAAENVLSGVRIPSQYRARIRSVLHTGIEHFYREAASRDAL